MNKQLTFTECRDYIQALKQKCTLAKVKGHRIEQILTTKKVENQVAVVVAEREQALVLLQDKQYTVFHFAKNKLNQKETLSSLARYQSEDYEFWIYKLDTEKLLCFVESDLNTLTVVHEEINFELGFRLRKSFLAQSEVEFVIFSWENGPMLLCSSAAGESFFALSDTQENIRDEKALDKVRSQYGDAPCRMRVLRNVAEDGPSISEEDIDDEMVVVEVDIAQSKKAPGEESVVTLDDPVPSLSKEEREVLEKYGIDVGEERDIPATLSSIEESVVTRDEELPALSPMDKAVLAKYGIQMPEEQQREQEKPVVPLRKRVVFEQSEVPLDDEVPLSEQEFEIFNKYGVNIARKEQTTPRKIREAFEDSVVVKDEELPPLKPEDLDVLKKYGISFAEPPKKPTARPKPKGRMIDKQDIVTFQFYGISLPKGETTTVAELRKIYQKAFQEGKIEKRIHRDDRKVFQKYQLIAADEPDLWNQLKTSDTVANLTTRIKKIQLQGTMAIAKVKNIDTKKTIDRARRYTILSIIGGVIVFSALGTFQLYRSYQAEQERIAREAQLRREKIANCRGVLGELEEYKKELVRKCHVIQKILDTLESKYPTSLGYPEASPKIPPYLAEISGKADGITKTIEDIEKLLAGEDLDGAVTNSNAARSLLDDKASKRLDSLLFKASSTLGIARFKRDVRDQETQARKSLRNIREHVVAFSQEVAELEENISILEKEFSTEDGYLAAPKGARETVDSTQGKIQLFRETFDSIEKLMLSGNLKKTVELSEPYLNMAAPDMAEIEDRLEAVKQTLTANREESRKRKKRAEFAALLENAKERDKQLQAELEELQNGLVELESFPESLEVPNPDPKTFDIRKKAMEELEGLRKAMDEGRNFLFQDQFDQAVAQLKPYSSAKNTVLPQLKQVKESVLDTIQIAKSAKERSERGYKIARLMQQVRKTLVPLREQVAALRKKVELKQQKFPDSEGFPKLRPEHEKVLALGRVIARKLERSLVVVGKRIEKKELERAISLLQRILPLSNRAGSALENIQEEIGLTEATIAQCHEELRNRQRDKEVRRGLAKINNYLQEIQTQIPPFAKSLTAMTEKFPASEGYPPIPERAEEVLERGKTLTQELETVVEEINKARANKDWEVSLTTLTPYIERGKLDSEFITQITKFRYELEDLVYQSEKIAKDKGQVQKIKELLAKMTQHQQELTDLTRDLSGSLRDLKRYKEEFYKSAPRGLDEALSEGKSEIKEVGSIIDDAENAFQSGKYKEALAILEIDMNWSRLPLIRNYSEQMDKILEENRRMASDPEFRRKAEEELKRKEEKEKRIQKNTRSPDVWYDELERAFLNEFEKMYPQITSSIQDQGASFMFNNAQVRTKGIRRFPRQMADLDELLYNIQRKGGDVRQMINDKLGSDILIPSKIRRLDKVKKYFIKRKIAVDIEEEIRELKSGLAQLKSDLQQGKKLRKSLKKIQNLLRRIEEQRFNEEYQDIYSELLNLDTSLPDPNK